MSLLLDLAAACQSSLPFGEAWKRLRCMRRGHAIAGSAVIDKLRSELHPHTDDQYIYTVYIYECSHCSLNFHATGIESRRPLGGV